MKDISSKTDNTSSLPAAAFNSMVSEMENIVTDAGLTLDNGSETTADPNPTQISAAIGAAGRDADAFTDSGSANTYTLTKIRGKAETAYRNGARFRFVPANTNTGASTVNIEGIGSKNIRFGDNSALTAGAIRANSVCQIYYDLSADNFKLIMPDSANTTVRGTVSYEDSGTFTANFNQGMNTSTNNITVRYSRVGKTVTLTFPQMKATNNSGLTTSDWFTGASQVPSALRPGVNVYGALSTINNDTNDTTMGRFYIATDGSVAITRLPTGWANGITNCGAQPWSVTFAIA